MSEYKNSQPAQLLPDGKFIGALMSGLLCGVLLARTLAGFVADHFGWRALYALAALLMLVLGFASARVCRTVPRR